MPSLPNPIRFWAELRRSFALLSLCLAALGADRRLIVANAGITLAVLLAFIATIGPDVLTGSAETMPDAQALAITALAALVRIAWTFNNATLTVIALARLRGEPTTYRAALAATAARFPAIALLSLLTVVVDFIARIFRTADGPGVLAPLLFVRDYIAESIDVAWQVATFVVLPVIMAERLGPVQSLRRGASLIGQTWGAGVGAVIGLRAAAIGLGAVGITAVSLVVSFIPAAYDAGLLFSLLYLAVVLTSLSSIGQVYRAAVYLHAIGEIEPAGFDRAELRAAFA